MPKPERTPYGTYRIRYTDPWGRRVCRTFDTAADARAHYRKVQGDIARGDYTDPRRRRRTTLAEWADDWLAGARNLSTGGRDTYRRDLDRHILPKLGAVPVAKLTATDIDRFLADLTRSTPARVRSPSGGALPGHRGGRADQSKALAPSTVHRQYRTLHRMLRVAVDRGVITRNPCDPVEPPRIPKVERTVLDVAQVDALAAAISPRYRAWVYVMAYGGLRWSESVGLRRGRIDGNHVSILEQLIRRGSGEWERVEPKAGSRRTLTLPGFVADELAGHLDTYAAPGPDGLVFPTRNGTPLLASSFRGNILARALTKAGLPHVRVHDLRHTAVSLAIAAGADPKASQARAGHSSIGVHLDVYGHLYPAADAAVAAALDDLHAKAQRPQLHAV